MIGIDYKYNFKFIVIGSSGVGKTAICQRLVDDTFYEETPSTIGVEYRSTAVEIDGNAIKLQIWDTAGQEKFASIAKSYFRQAVGVILVFDITDRQSFNDLSKWLSDVRSLCDPNAAVTLIGNKLDLSSSRKISVSEAQQFATHNQLEYLEVSAKGGDNITEAFQRAAKAVYEKAESNLLSTQTAAPEPAKESEKSGCC